MRIDTVAPKHRSSWMTPQECKSYYGVPYQFREIQIHWWNDPSTHPSHDGTVNYIANKTSGSVNYVASAGHITKMVPEENCAITTQNGNPYGIKIECSPYGTDEDYAAFAYLIADIRRRRGNLPLTPHKKYWSTTCPGTLDLARMDREANALLEGGDMYEGKTAEEWAAMAKDAEPYKQQVVQSTAWPRGMAQDVNNVKFVIDDLQKFKDDTIANPPVSDEYVKVTDLYIKK